MLVQEACHIIGADVLSGLQEAPGQYAYGICVCLHEISHDLRELDLILQGSDLVFSPWQQGR